MDNEKRIKAKRSKHKKKHKKHKKKRYSSSSSSSTEDEWVEKNPLVEMNKKTINDHSPKRDSWMTDLTFNIPTTSNQKLKIQAKIDEAKNASLNTYNPSKSSRELNPYWKDGGDGLPSLSRSKNFLKPGSEYKIKSDKIKSLHSSPVQSSGDWRKKPSNDGQNQLKYDSTNQQKVVELKLNLTDKEINDLAARVLKAEIMGNQKLHDELKLQLEKAREYRKNNGPTIITSDKNDVIMSVTDEKGQTKPVLKHELNEPSTSKKRQKVPTHVHGERVRYFGDDDRYNLNEMFEKEKLTSGYDDEASFVKIASKLKHTDDEVTNLFENTSFDPSAKEVDERNKAKALKEHKTLLNCWRCIDSDKFNNQLTIQLGDNVYLSIPPYQSITEWHCFLIPIRHVSCSTQLDEDEWNELQEFRKKLSNIFAKQNHVTIFFECAKDLHKYPHMMIECVPIPEQDGSLAPMYFKKAILECEKEWSNNKKLIELKKSDVRRVIPKGLSYFSVEFDSEPGFAHVIEDRRDFPKNFAQEIIGGLLDLHHSVWRKPRYENSSEIISKVNNFKKIWIK